ncbi:50S ribosomal protein L21 [Candidatus Collierbacteria bacterium]|nr:50S ribosomal protein L21 [Candidatus Collierbacteria bacterium]
MATKNPSNTLAVIKIGAKQYLVHPGDKVKTEKVDLKEKDKLSVKDVLLLQQEDKTLVGTPFVEGASVDLILDKNAKDEKIRVVKFKAKSRYRRTTGHRQSVSFFTVSSLNSN